MSVAKNTAFMTIAAVGQKILAFAYFTIIARMVGAEGTGKYFLALSFTTIFAVIADFGLAPTLSREVARKPKKASKYLGNILAVKIFFMLGTYLAVVIVANILNYPIDTRQLIYLSGLTMIFDSIHLSIYAVLRGLHNLRYEAIAVIASQATTLTIGTTALFMGAPLIWLIAAFTVPSFLNVIYAGIMLIKKAKIRIKLNWDKKLIKTLLLIALPFALAGIFTRIYSFSDTIILSKLMDDAAVGWYSIPNKITFAFQFVPLALVAALYPRMSEAFVCDKKHLKYLFEVSMKYLIIIALPVSIGLGVLAPEVILTIYTSEYAASILPLQILLASLIFAFLDFPIGALLNGCNRQATQTTIMGTAMVVNVAANFLMIPIWGVVGAALAALVGNIVLMVGGYIFVPKIVKINHTKLLGILLSTLFIAVIMGAVVLWAKLVIPWYFTILLGAVVYLGGLFLVRLVTLRDSKYFVAKISSR